MYLGGPFPFHLIFHSGFDGLSNSEKEKKYWRGRERERERERVCVCVCAREIGKKSVCVCRGDMCAYFLEREREKCFFVCVCV